MTRTPRLRLKPQRLLIAAALLGAAGCGEENGTGPGNTGPCTGNVTVSVSPGTTPTFTWTPACRVIALLVEQEASDQWFLLATGDGFGPSVTYGTVPAGAAADEPATPLTAGITYEVILFRGTEANPVIAGMREFTP